MKLIGQALVQNTAPAPSLCQTLVNTSQQHCTAATSGCAPCSYLATYAPIWPNLILPRSFMAMAAPYSGDVLITLHHTQLFRAPCSAPSHTRILFSICMCHLLPSFCHPFAEDDGYGRPLLR